jgi:hypothetical protein
MGLRAADSKLGSASESLKLVAFCGIVLTYNLIRIFDDELP